MQADTDRLLCKECLRLSRLKSKLPIPKGKLFEYLGNKYIVTNDCKVFSIKSMRYISPIQMQNGYIMYSFGAASKGTRKQCYAHRLQAFVNNIISSIDEDILIDHIDGNKSNNELNNLRRATYSDNELYKRQNKGMLFAYKDNTKYGPFSSVKDMYKYLQIDGTLGSFYTQVSRGIGFGYIFKRENI